MRKWGDDLRLSARMFQEVVWPEISPYIGGGTLRSLETGDDDLDRAGGIDGYQLFKTGVRTIAQRTQFVDEYNKPGTFTIRKARRTGACTEFQKRLTAINQGFDVPALVIQAYVHTTKQFLMRVGIAHGTPFYAYALSRPERWRELYARDDGNAFLVVPFLDICRDNARDTTDAQRSEVPFLAKDGMGYVHRSPDTFFDRHPCYFTDLRRHDTSLRWI